VPDLKLLIEPATVKGFLDLEEGALLYASALEAAAIGPCLEIGSYCGKSALYLGAACRERGQVLFTVDHHRGSEELQPGWAHHDPETWDARAGKIDTLPLLRRTLHDAGLEQTVIAIVGQSAVIARHWRTPLGLLFIDGGHAHEIAFADYRGWSGHVMRGGLLAIHDVFPNPRDGGRPPFEVYRTALESGLFMEASASKSLRVLRRL
jgi:predicted O-methyltransferase YrrM